MVDAILKYLQISFEQKLIDILKENGMRCLLTVEDTGDEILRKLKPIEGRLKRMVIDLQLKQADLQKIQDDTKPSAGKYHFYEILSILSSHNGYAVRANDITVYQYCRMVKNLEEQQNRQAIKNLHGT